jgi:diguanylate cyclase (GGDEF)-like protein/PAS domain S-box-containing protein
MPRRDVRRSKYNPFGLGERKADGMSLRVRVELILFIVFGVVIGLSYGIQRFVIIPGLDPVEREAALKDMERSSEALERQAGILQARAAAWANIIEKNIAGGESDTVIPEDELDSSAMSAAFWFKSSGETAWSYGAPDQSGSPRTFAEFVSGLKPEHRFLLRTVEDGNQIAGALLTTEGAAIAAVAPIHASSGDKASLLLVFRLIDASLRSQMYQQAGIDFQIWPVNDPALAPEERGVVQELLAGRDVQVAEAGADEFRVYSSYAGLSGEPVLLLRSQIHRNLLARARSTMESGLLAEVGIGLVALVVLVILFRRTVMNSLSMLTAHATAIGSSNDLSARLRMDRSDELGTLAAEFNRMLEKLAEDRARQIKIKEQLRESEERYALAVRGANDGLWDWNLLANELHYSTRWKSMLGYQESEIGNSPDEWLDRIHPDDRENVLAALEAHTQLKTAHFESEHRIRHKSSNYIWVLCRGLAVQDSSNAPARMAGSQTDITLRKVFEEQLRHQALHDSLTSLPNRALFLDRLTQAIRLSERQKDYHFAVIFLDLDRFKVLNDGLGHVIGDSLLNMFAEKLQQILRAVDTVCRHTGTLARFGGDEFVLLLDNISGVGDATLVASRIERMLQEPFEIEQHEVFTTASIGIAMSGPGYSSPEELIRNADTAMYRAKARGRSCFEIFDADMHSKAIERLQLENNLRRAIERGEFCVHYQPIVCLKTGRILAFESLVRWEHPDRGMISPIEFIPVAEETGMIVAIGEFVLRTSCLQLREWRRQCPGQENLMISVNLSVKEFSKANLIGSIADILTETDVSPHHLKLEITESALMESVEFVTRTLRQLRDMGIQLAIDDFGTGYSSLSYLHRFPMHTLKVDQAFIRDMSSSHESGQIVKTVLLLAQALSMSTIAEGIEGESQALALRALHCEAGQGYYFSRPLPAAEATALLNQPPPWFKVADGAD